MRSDAGFSIVEMTVALLLTLTLAGAVFGLVNQAQATSQAQPEAIDMQQRARVAADLLLHELVMAGAGLSTGASAGSLLGVVAPVIPRRMGLQNADAPTVARADAITVMYVPAGGVEGTVEVAFAGPSADLVVNPRPGCAVGAPLCSLASGMTTLLFDASGRFDVFGVTQVSAASSSIRLLGLAASGGYEPGDGVAEVEFHTYYFDAASRQLRYYDGNATDVPVVDDVVSLTFAYFGEPAAPDRPMPPPGVENCLYDATGSPKPLATLTADGGSLAPLPLAMLRDGPWCGSGSTQFDADLLRVRAIRVTLRVQATPPAFRARGSAFAQTGVSRASSRWLADYVMTFDVVPRNLNLSR